MLKTAFVITLQAAGIVAASAAIAIVVDLVRPDGIPLITDIEYEIFSRCKDADVESEQAGTDDLAAASGGAVLYVDARPADAFALEHVEGAINVPYSALFGASAADVKNVREAAEKSGAKSIVVYGIFGDPANPADQVDFAEPLAQQLLESEVPGVKHLEGGLAELKKSGVRTVKSDGGTK